MGCGVVGVGRHQLLHDLERTLAVLGFLAQQQRHRTQSLIQPGGIAQRKVPGFRQRGGGQALAQVQAHQQFAGRAVIRRQLAPALGNPYPQLLVVGGQRQRRGASGQARIFDHAQCVQKMFGGHARQIAAGGQFPGQDVVFGGLFGVNAGALGADPQVFVLRHRRLLHGSAGGQGEAQQDGKQVGGNRFLGHEQAQGEQRKSWTAL